MERRPGVPSMNLGLVSPSMSTKLAGGHMGSPAMSSPIMGGSPTMGSPALSSQSTSARGPSQLSSARSAGLLGAEFSPRSQDTWSTRLPADDASHINLSQSTVPTVRMSDASMSTAAAHGSGRSLHRASFSSVNAALRPNEQQQSEESAQQALEDYARNLNKVPQQQEVRGQQLQNQQEEERQQRINSQSMLLRRESSQQLQLRTDSQKLPIRRELHSPQAGQFGGAISSRQTLPSTLSRYQSDVSAASSAPAGTGVLDRELRGFRNFVMKLGLKYSMRVSEVGELTQALEREGFLTCEQLRHLPEAVELRLGIPPRLANEMRNTTVESLVPRPPYRPPQVPDFIEDVDPPRAPGDLRLRRFPTYDGSPERPRVLDMGGGFPTTLRLYAPTNPPRSRSGSSSRLPTPREGRSVERHKLRHERARSEQDEARASEGRLLHGSQVTLSGEYLPDVQHAWRQSTHCQRSPVAVIPQASGSTRVLAGMARPQQCKEVCSTIGPSVLAEEVTARRSARRPSARQTSRLGIGNQDDMGTALAMSPRGARHHIQATVDHSALLAVGPMSRPIPAALSLDSLASNAEEHQILQPDMISTQEEVESWAKRKSYPSSQQAESVLKLGSLRS